jgi:MoaA/NifB/PqqE/SkfB family radical SAM enzyme
VLKALEKAKAKRIYTTLSVSISRQNWESIGYILGVAKAFSVKAFFQPVTERAGADPECGGLSPDPGLFREITERLIKEKRRNRFIGNSEAGLRHLSRWPEETSIPCLAGRAICRIGPDGQVYACTTFRVADPALNIAKRNPEECFNGLASCRCKECWCSLLVELNMIGKLTPKVLLDVMRG